MSTRPEESKSAPATTWTDEWLEAGGWGLEEEGNDAIV
jgi:hypothetical protein